MRGNTLSIAALACLTAPIQADLVPRALPKCTSSASKALSILKACPSASASSYCNQLWGTSTTTVKKTVKPPAVTTVVTTTITSGTTTTTTTTSISTSTTASTDTETDIETVMKRATAKSCNLSSSFKTYPASIVTSACSCYKTQPHKTVTSTITGSASTVTLRSTLSTKFTETSTSTESSLTTQTDLTTVTTDQCTASPTSHGCQAQGYNGGMIATCDLRVVPSADQATITATSSINLDQCGDLCCNYYECNFADYTQDGGLCTIYAGPPEVASATGVAFLSYAQDP